MTHDVEIVYYTDPLCPWSWGLEPQWRRLRYEFGRRLRWRYCMGGLLPDWDHFHDLVNAISRPGQMGPACVQAAEATGMPIDASLWFVDPPQSSYPACLAFKAAESQGAWAAEAYLRRLREAAMLERQNPARTDVLDAIAVKAASDLPPERTLDPARFCRDFRSDAAREALREDLKEARYHGIERFPTLAFSRPGGKPILCVGHRPYPSLRSAVEYVAPGLTAQRLVSAKEYLDYWGRLTLRELAEALELEETAAASLMETIS